MKPKYTCQVCGKEADPEVIAHLPTDAWWMVHQIHRVGGIVPVMTCPDCSSLTQDLIMQSYVERIRLGLVPGFH